MRIYAGRIPDLASEIVDALIAKNYIEVQQDLVGEVKLDVESVLKEYVRTEKEITEKAKDQIAKTGEDHRLLGKIKSLIAQKMGFGLGEDAPQYIINQIIEILMISKNVDEVFAQDNEITALLLPILKKYAGLEDELDQEIRKRIKNLQEGTTEWEIEYQKLMSTLRETKKL